MGTRTQAVGVDGGSSRQLELLGEAPAAPAADMVLVAYDRPRKRPSGGTARGLIAPRVRNRRRDRPGLARLAVSPDDAAEMLGVSRDYFDEHIIGELRIVRRGRRILVAVAELDRWLTRNATRAGAPPSV